MHSVKLTPEFNAWFASIRDSVTRKRLGMRLRKAQLGNLGDVKLVGQGVWEMREFFGSGWRMYYVLHGATLVVMLGGGDKATQQADIAKVVALAQDLSMDGLS